MNRVHLLLKSDWSIVLIMTGAVKQIVEEGRILVTVHHIFSTNNGMQNLISALKTSQPNGFTDPKYWGKICPGMPEISAEITSTFMRQ